MGHGKHVTGTSYESVLPPGEYLDEHYDGIYEFDDDIALHWYRAQTFTPQQNIYLSKVSLLVGKLGNPGTLTISIRNTDTNGLPTGSDICFRQRNTTDMIEWPDALWYDFQFLVPPLLQAGKRYAIVGKAPSGFLGNWVTWKHNDTSDLYLAGEVCGSVNDGNTWIKEINCDYMFKTYRIIY